MKQGFSGLTILLKSKALSTSTLPIQAFLYLLLVREVSLYALLVFLMAVCLYPPKSEKTAGQILKNANEYICACTHAKKKWKNLKERKELQS